MADFEGARRTMVDTQLRTVGVSDHRLLQAFLAVPREQFVPDERKPLAYIDERHPLSNGRYLPPSGPIAKMLQLAGVQHTDKVLDIACANGYTTAILAQLATEVVGIDTDPELARQAQANLSSLNVANARVTTGPLADGARAEAPFDLIVIEGAVDEVPAGILEQLKDGGRLVTLIRGGATATAYLYVRSGREFSPRAAFNAVLPVLDLVKGPESFVF